MKEEYTPVKSCVVGIPFSTGKPSDRTNKEIEVVPVVFLYTKVSELITRCAEAGVVLLQDPKQLTDANQP